MDTKDLNFVTEQPALYDAAHNTRTSCNTVMMESDAEAALTIMDELVGDPVSGRNDHVAVPSTSIVDHTSIGNVQAADSDEKSRTLETETSLSHVGVLVSHVLRFLAGEDAGHGKRRRLVAQTKIFFLRETPTKI